MQGHFLKNTMEFLEYPAPAVMDVYTPCGSEHGISEAPRNARPGSPWRAG
jgi:pyruvate-ferredoxin/flavodoxin oxidoreductase